MAKTEIIYTATLDASGIVTGVNQANQSFELFESGANKLKTPLKGAKDGFEDMNTAAGVAGSTVTEFGRLLSDAPYGIQGMANNLSQLGSMFSLLVVKAQKMNNEFTTFQNIKKLLTAQILGPVGILVAFQAIIAAIEVFTSKQKKASDTVNDFNQSMFAQGEILLNLREQFRQGNLTFEQREQIIKKLALADSKLNDVINSTTLSQAQKNKIYEDYINIQEKITERETALMEAQKLLEEANYEGVISQEEYSKAIIARDELEAVLKNNSAERGLAQSKQTLDEIKDKIKLFEANELIYSSEAVLYDLREQQSNLFNKTKTQEEKAIRGTVDYYQNRIKQLTEERDGVARSAKEIDNYNKKIKALQDALNILLFARKQNKVENLIQILGLADIDKEEVAEQIAANVPTSEEIIKALKAKMAGEESTAFLEKFLGLKESAQKTIEIAEQIGEGLSVIGDFFDAEAERDIAREKNKTTKVNNELRDRLKNENLSATERERINKRIATNEFNLDKSLDKIREKQFKQQKAFKIAIALADTASMAAKAYLSQLSVPTTDAVGRAKVAAKIATAFGLLQVATIARQKYVSGQTSVAGLGGASSSGTGGGEPSAPDFNVVGASQLNQVAAAVAAQREQPIRTYVVASDVSTAQELDRNILSEASIG